jgi:RND family efflux transporter MFP subunit
MSRPVRVFAAVAFTCTLLELLSGCQRAESADPRLSTPLVTAVAVESATHESRGYTGVIAARVQSDLGFRVQGKVVERLVDTGQHVKRGARLMRIDPTDYSHAIQVQAGDVAAARARWVQADADEKRYRGLVDTGAISQLTYDQAKAAADAAKGLYAAAEAQERVARNQGDYSTLVADADGVITETLAEPGQVVAAGQTVMRLAHAGPREAAINLPETERPQIGSEAHASIYGDSALVPVRLRQVSDAADLKTRTFEARYVLEEGGTTVPLGATVTVYLDGAESTGLEVPLGAIDDEGNGPGVWVITDKLRVTYRPVRIQRFGTQSAILTAGARPGETVVAVGGHFLHEGEGVRIADTKVAMQ